VPESIYRNSPFMVESMFCRSLSRIACRGVVAPPPPEGCCEAVVVGVCEGRAAAVTGLWEDSDPPPLPLVPGEDCTLIGLKYIHNVEITHSVMEKSCSLAKYLNLLFIKWIIYKLLSEL
jgi:hypothetical protein